MVHIKEKKNQKAPHCFSLSESGEQLAVLEVSEFLEGTVPARGMLTARGQSMWRTRCSWSLRYLRKCFQVPGWSFLGHSFMLSVLSLCQDRCVSE